MKLCWKATEGTLGSCVRGPLTDSILLVNLLTISRLEGFCSGLKPMWGIGPMSSRNRGCCIAEWTWLLELHNR